MDDFVFILKFGLLTISVFMLWSLFDSVLTKISKMNAKLVISSIIILANIGTPFLFQFLAVNGPEFIQQSWIENSKDRFNFICIASHGISVFASIFFIAVTLGGPDE